MDFHGLLVAINDNLLDRGYLFLRQIGYGMNTTHVWKAWLKEKYLGFVDDERDFWDNMLNHFMVSISN